MIMNSPMTQLPSMGTAYANFRQKYPMFDSKSVDKLRAKEYGRLDKMQQVYLDYTGGGLYAESQLHRHMKLLRRNIFGNPHSTNPASHAMTVLVERARTAVLEFFHASPAEYTVIFTANATGALKLVGEAYPFASGGQYLLTSDNHNSVNGVRKYARAGGATFTYVPLTSPELRVNEAQMLHSLDQAASGHHHLFAYPAQSNVSGVQHSLEWITLAQQRGWDVLVDCAAFAPTNRLDLSRWHPDFVPLSFYKIFGYPTGVGCLLARKAAFHKLRRPWYSGGTIVLSSVIAAWDDGEGFYLKPDQEGFEDGTLNYLLLPAVEIGLQHIDSIGIDVLHERVQCLTSWLLESLLSLYHSNGMPVVQIYGPKNTENRGGTIAFNFSDPAGNLLDCYKVQEEANSWNISLRSGCFCNPGVREIALDFKREELTACFQGKGQLDYQQFLARIDGRPVQGALRVSLGLATNFADIYRFLQFVRSFVDKRFSHAHAGRAENQKIFMCSCGYQNDRRKQRFCPHCGKPTEA